MRQTAKILPASSPTLDLLFSSTHETPEATVEAAMKMAHEIANNNSMISMAVTKALVWRGGESPEDTHLLDSAAIHTVRILPLSPGSLRILIESFVAWKRT